MNRFTRKRTYLKDSFWRSPHKITGTFGVSAIFTVGVKVNGLFPVIEEW